MSSIDVYTQDNGIVVIQSYGGSARERGAKIGAAVRRMRAAGLTVELIAKSSYEGAEGFQSCSVARYQTAVAPVEETMEYRVWCENGDLVHVGDNLAEAEAALADAIRDHVENDCHDGDCGVMTAHGFSIQICKDGQDVTGDPSY